MSPGTEAGRQHLAAMADWYARLGPVRPEAWATEVMIAAAIAAIEAEAAGDYRRELAEKVRALEPLDIGGLDGDDEWVSQLVLDRAIVLGLIEPAR